MEVLILLKALLININYSKYISYININYIKEYNNNIYKLYILLINLQQSNPKDYTCDDLEIVFRTSYPVLNKEDQAYFEDLFNRLRAIIISEDLIINYLESIRRQEQATRLAEAALRVREGRDEWDALQSLISGLNEFPCKVETTSFVETDLEELYEHTIKAVGLRWRSQTLNKMLGSLRKGDFGFIFARPETGKTTFLASEVSYMASMATDPIIWFNNEEQGRKVMLRIYQATFGVTLEELFQNKELYRQQYNALVGDKIRVYPKDTTIISKRDVEKVCREIKPGLIIIDQIDKIAGFQNDRYDLELKEVYSWARELAREYGPTIGVCQAGGSGEGKKWLTMNDVDSSKTSKQGAADWILGIGKTYDPGMEFIRHLHLSKNKLHGDADSIPELRHGKMDIMIEPEIARYKDIMEYK